jgi:hypothetical protein
VPQCYTDSGWSIVENVKHGTLVNTPADRSTTYTPDAGFVGDDYAKLSNGSDFMYLVFHVAHRTPLAELNDQVRSDGVPEFAAGYGWGGQPLPPYGGGSAGLTELPVPLWLSSASRIRINYAASDPSAVTRTGTGTVLDPYTYHAPSTGSLRLWLIPGGGEAPRSLLNLSQASGNEQVGFFVPSTPAGQWIIGTELVALQQLISEGARFYVEGVRPSAAALDQTIEFDRDTTSLDAEDDGDPPTIYTDTFRYTVAGTDLRFGSNALPAQSPEDMQREHDPHAERQNAIIVNDGDVNKDGIPDFAEGFIGAPGGHSSALGVKFTPIIIALPSLLLDPTSLSFDFDYFGGSDPLGVRSYDAADPLNSASRAAPGYMRLWRVDGTEIRNGNEVGSAGGGDYIVSGGYYTASELGLQPGATSLTVYVEAVRASGQPQRIQVAMSWSDAIAPYTLATDPWGSYYERYDQGGGLGSSVPVTILQDWSPNASISASGLRYADDTAAVENDDVPGGAMTRVWTNRPDLSVNDVYGNGWRVAQLPSLVDFGASVRMIRGGDERYFDRTRSSYQERFGGHDVLTHTSGQFILTDAAGNQTSYYDFSPSIPLLQRGQFKGLTNAAGVETATTVYSAQGLLDSMAWQGSLGPPETYHYDYFLSGPNTARLSSLTVEHSASPYRQVDYEYSTTVGAAGDLKAATIRDPRITGPNNIVNILYYTGLPTLGSLDVYELADQTSLQAMEDGTVELGTKTEFVPTTSFDWETAFQRIDIDLSDPNSTEGGRSFRYTSTKNGSFRVSGGSPAPECSMPGCRTRSFTSRSSA